jgi:hypothetical protein
LQIICRFKIIIIIICRYNNNLYFIKNIIKRTSLYIRISCWNSFIKKLRRLILVFTKNIIPKWKKVFSVLRRSYILQSWLKKKFPSPELQYSVKRSYSFLYCKDIRQEKALQFAIKRSIMICILTLVYLLEFVIVPRFVVND